LISYEPLWKTMKNKGISSYRLLQMGIDNHTLQRLRDNDNITMITAEKLCTLLNCTIEDIVEFINDDSLR